MEKKMFSGGVFSRQFKSGKAFGSIEMTDRSVCFRHENGKIELPLDGIQIRAGGAGGKMFFFTHASVPDCSFFTSDPDVLKSPNLKRISGVQDQLTRIQQAKTRTFMAWIVLLVIVIGVIFGLFKIKEPVCKAIAARVPAEWENQLGETVFAQIKITSAVIEDSDINNMMQKIADPIFKTISCSRYRFKIHVVKNPTINAFALPGGHIVFHSGLILAAESPEEIAAVMAHEVSHITLQHGLRNMIGAAGMYLLIQALFGNTEGIMGTIVNNGAYLINMKYSRDYEREADDTGWSYLVKAGIPPDGMITFFQNLLKEEKKTMPTEMKDRVNDALSYISTHPATSERIARLQEKLKTMDSHPSSPYNLDFNTFKEKIRNI